MNLVRIPLVRVHEIGKSIQYSKKLIQSRGRGESELESKKFLKIQISDVAYLLISK